MLQLNIGFTFERALTLFTRSDMTLPKVNRFRWNLKESEYIVSGWPWQILGAIRAVARSGSRVRRNFLSDKQHTILPISVGQISRNLNTTRRSVWRWILLEQNFENFSVTCRLKKLKKMKFFQSLATSGCHNSAIIIDRRKFITKWSLFRMSSFHFYRWN